MGHVAALVRSHLNVLNPFGKEQTTETPSHKTVSATAMMTNRIMSLRELLHYQMSTAIS